MGASILLSSVKVACNPSNILGRRHEQIDCLESRLRLAVSSNRLYYCSSVAYGAIGGLQTRHDVNYVREHAVGKVLVLCEPP